jgi:hypothetical protein
MPELHSPRHRDQSCALRGSESTDTGAEAASRSQDQPRVSASFGGGNQQPQPGLLTEPTDLRGEPVTDSPARRQRAGFGPVAGQVRASRVRASWVRARQPRGQLEERERVALRVGEHPVPQYRVQFWRMIVDQLTGRTGAQRGKLALRQTRGGELRRTGIAGRKDHRHALGLQAPGREQQRVRGRGIEPVRVINQAQHRLGFGQQAKYREADQEPALTVSALGTARLGEEERTAERLGLARGQRLHPVEQRPQQQVQSGERQFCLSLDAGAAQYHDARGRGLMRGLVKQCALADPGLAADDQGSAAPAAYPRQQRGDGRGLCPPSEHHRAPRLPNPAYTRNSTDPR